MSYFHPAVPHSSISASSAPVTMFFQRPKSYTITLQQAHSLLKISRDSTKSITGETHLNIPSRDQIQDAFRAAAKLHHPDLATSGAYVNNLRDLGSTVDATVKSNAQMFRECHEARELLLDYYVRRKYIHPEILSSTKNNPKKTQTTRCSQYGHPIIHYK